MSASTTTRVFGGIAAALLAAASTAVDQLGLSNPRTPGKAHHRAGARRVRGLQRVETV